MPDFLFYASLIGGIAFALSGFIIGVRRNMDWMGIFILAFLTANGGGILRDVLIGKTPTVLLDPTAFLMVIGVFVVGLILHFIKGIDIEKRSFFILSDSIGLVAFSITGAIIGLDAELSLFGVMALSFITAVGGGILRDILVNDVPIILQSDFYGTIALMVGGVIYALHYYNYESPVSMIAVFITALIIRMTAWKLKWRLPKA